MQMTEFDLWLEAIDYFAAQRGFLGESYTECTPISCWQGMYSEGYEPQDAFDEAWSAEIVVDND
jgi:hypothetical protein